MDKVFVIFENYDDYESQPYAIGFTDSRESADAVCAKLDSYLKIANEVGEKAREFVKLIYDEDLGLESGENWPKWPAGIHQKDITVEMREERDLIKKENDEKNKRNFVKTSDQRNRIENAVVEFIDGLDYDEDLMKYIKRKISGVGYFSWLLPYSNQEVKKLS
jgi:hypothetical protein